jgi:hypothetical protein
LTATAATGNISVRTTALNHIIENRGELNLETHIAFIDLEKAFYRTDRSNLWEILDKRGYHKHLINVVINTYIETKIKTKLGDGRLSQDIVTNKGMRQGCSLSPLLLYIYIYTMS